MTKCKTCAGKGRWEERKETGDEVSVEQLFCHNCNGRGYIVEEENIDDFDLAGVGATELDDD